MDRTIEQTRKSLETMVFNPEGLVHWTKAMEVTANNMQNDKNSKIKFRYEAREKSIEFFLKDYKSRDYIVKSIEIHLPLIPESLQGFFSVFKYHLKNMRLDN